VIGGGDWNKDHIVADSMTALLKNKPIEVRNPKATRPWQHALEALGGYLLLGTKLLEKNGSKAAPYCEAFNFGPIVNSNRTVGELVDEIVKNWGSGSWKWTGNRKNFHESTLLNLSIDKAFQRLHWLPQWNFEETVKRTVDWYKVFGSDKKKVEEFTISQIVDYHNRFGLGKK